MKTIILTIIILVPSFLFLANTTISFKPFKIELNNWLSAIGWFLILFGVLIIQHDAKKTVVKSVREIINKLNEDK